MKTNTTIQKWGNSQGLRLKKEILRDMDLSVGDRIKVSVVSGSIIITPGKRQRRKVDLKKLLSKVSKNYKSKEVNWGTTAGKEIW